MNFVSALTSALVLLAILNITIELYDPYDPWPAIFFLLLGSILAAYFLTINPF